MGFVLTAVLHWFYALFVLLAMGLLGCVIRVFIISVCCMFGDCSFTLNSWGWLWVLRWDFSYRCVDVVCATCCMFVVLLFVCDGLGFS